MVSSTIGFWRKMDEKSSLKLLVKRKRFSVTLVTFSRRGNKKNIKSENLHLLDLKNSLGKSD